MASASSGRSSTRSSACGGRGGDADRGTSWSPIAYLEGALEYKPAVYCKCKKKAPRWISWSIMNPGRRYYACINRRAGGCDFWQWHDEGSTTPFVKQLLIDLRDKVWALAKENAELRDSFADARSGTEQQLFGTLQWTALTTALADKESEVFSLTGNLKKLETQRQLLVVAIIGCMCIVVGMLFT
ncbi:hypothetical protein PVAP13_1NG116138 [Panicum virgatum]|uniref:GRF-type domain-containing protein n=1 Tax=Panicum virgatum TaxID=38727 RepID=A0A8T0WRC0_PANVG|nr:hypothetical protein PVAP13_1NG116138 [Panicum virgatum]